MKKKYWILIVLTVLLILFVPIPGGTYKDGGTRTYTALTYKIVDWKRITADGAYEKTKVYFGPDSFRSIDDLWWQEQVNVESTFYATVTMVGFQDVVVEPLPGEPEGNSSDQIAFSYGDMKLNVRAGNVVRICYKGGIRETYPAQIDMTYWEIADDLRHTEYAGQWLDREQADHLDSAAYADLEILAIYSDCFIAAPVVAMPTQYKIIGSLSESWCVGDWVTVTYEDIYNDNENDRVEGTLVRITESDIEESDDAVCYKPVIYLYPHEETQAQWDMTKGFCVGVTLQ